MIFYFDRQTGQRVKKSTWTRSKAQGGSRYVRRSSGPGQPKNPPKGSKPSDGSSERTPSQAPRTYQEYKAYFEKLSKRRRRQIEEDDFSGSEYETGVDY